MKSRQRCYTSASETLRAPNQNTSLHYEFAVALQGNGRMDLFTFDHAHNTRHDGLDQLEYTCSAALTHWYALLRDRLDGYVTQSCKLVLHLDATVMEISQPVRSGWCVFASGHSLPRIKQ